MQLLCIILAALLLIFTHRVRRAASMSALFIVFFLFGIYQGGRHAIDTIDSRHIAAQLTEPQQAVLIGTLANMVTYRNGFSRALMDVSYIRTKVSPVYQKAEGTILLNLKGKWPEPILPGHSFIVSTETKTPPVTNVPGTFNYRKYLARKGVHLVGVVRSPMLIQPIEQLSNMKFKQLKYLIERWRYHIGQRIDITLSQPRSSLYRALLIGDRSQIDDELYETIKRAGILHILAISGMHLGLLAALAFAAIYRLMCCSERLLLSIDVRKCALIFTLPLLALYAFLAGFQPPVVRSLIMTSCLVIGYSATRLHSPLPTLACSALIILLFDPLAVESAAFQLSFAAVASIILITPSLQSLFMNTVSTRNDMVKKLFIAIFTLLSVTLAASIGTLPLMLLHFNRLSMVGIAANLLIEPIICLFCLPLGFFSVLLMSLAPPLGALILQLGSNGLDLSITIATFLTGPDFTQVWLPAPGIISCFLYYVFLGVLFCSSCSLKWVLPGVGGFFGALISFYPPLSGIPDAAQPSTRISILDVGHGSSNVIEMRSGRVVLIDGGAKSQPGYSCGERIIAPFLWSRNIARVDDVFLTHDDADHYNGIAAVIERFKPARLWIPTENSPKKGFARLLAYARDSEIEIYTPEPGMIINDGDEAISILGSYTVSLDKQITGDRYESNSDDNGLVIKLRALDTTVLFPGDITMKREKNLVDNLENLYADILLSPHHGSSTSNSDEFLEAVAPEVVIYSNKEHLKDLFPARETAARVNRLGFDSMETATEGTITITVGTEQDSTAPYRISTYNITARKYWTRG